MPAEIGVFAKHWTPGRVKTRLAAAIGDERAAAVAKLFVEALVARLASAADRRVIGYSPESSRPAFAELAGDSWRLVAQCEGDLGARMRHFFGSAFDNGADRVVLLGADSPNVPIEIVRDALQRLRDQRLVLGPTEDGGYYLIGARGEPPPVSDAMPWSTPDLWQATVARLEEVGWRRGVDWSPLPTWYDVDTIEDLSRLRADLAASASDPALRSLSASLAETFAD